MQYTGFKVKNFKGISDLDLDFSSNPNFKVFTLVGLNESGKTTILEAINMLEDGVPKEKRHLLIPRGKNRNFNDSVIVEGTLVLDSQDELEIKQFAKNIGIELVKEIRKFSLKKIYVFKDSLFHEEKNLWTITLIGKKKRAKKEKVIGPGDTEWQPIIAFMRDKIMPPIIYYPNFLADFPNRIYLEPQEKESKQQPEYRRVLQDILDSLNEGMKLDEHILQRIKAAKAGNEAEKGALAAVLETMGTKITEDVFRAWEKILSSKDKQSIKGKQIMVNYDVEIIKGSDGIEKPAPYIEIKVKEGPELYQISERSLGFRWFFSYFLFTEFRKNRSNDKGEIIFLIDEPASNLHSTAQRKLLETFGELIKKSKLIYTTHSHHLIEPLWLEGAYIVQNKAMKYEESELTYNIARTDIEALPYRQFVASHPDQQTYFQPIFDKLDYQPSKLEMVPDVVVVEGKNDFYTLKYIHELFLKNEFQGLNLYPGNGAGGNDKIIRLYVSWGKNFLVLSDGDTAGTTAKQDYEQQIGKIVEGKVFSLADISKSFAGKSMEGIFSTDAERMRVIKKIFPRQATFSKQKFNLAIQNLLFLKDTVQLNQTTLNNFRKVFAFLTTELSKQHGS